MRTFAERVTGKAIRGIEINEPGTGIGVLFTDGTGMIVHSRVNACLQDVPNGFMVERVTSDDKEVILHLGGGGSLAISTDGEKHEVVEFFVYIDTDGTYLISN